MTTYKGPDDVTANVSFGRQLSTGGIDNGLPSGSVVDAVDPPTGCADTLLLTMPPGDGMSTPGVFFTEASSDNRTTRIQTVVLPFISGTKPLSYWLFSIKWAAIIVLL